MNLLIVSAGTRYKLVTYFKENGSGFGRVVTTDCSKFAPALYVSDQYYIVPRMNEPGYLSVIQEICKKEQIQAILPLQEDELELIAENRERFEALGILAIVSAAEGIKLCRDKYALYRHMRQKGVRAVPTWIVGQNEEEGEISFPVFVKPRYGCGSIGAAKIESRELWKGLVNIGGEAYVAQPFLDAEEYGVDVYIDLISQRVVSMFAKKKLRMRAGETEKSVSVLDTELFAFVEKALKGMPLMGPVDVDVFRFGGEYYLLEINPRFGGGYPHAFECGIGFPHMISVNAGGRENAVCIGNYEKDVVLLKYSDVVVQHENHML